MAISKRWEIKNPAGEVVAAVSFHTRFRTGGTDAMSRRFVRVISAHHQLEPTDVPVVDLLGYMISTTSLIEFETTDKAGEEIAEFARFWGWFTDTAAVIGERGGVECVIGFTDDDALLAEIWPRFQEMVGNTAQEAWYQGYRAGQNLYRSDPLIAPESTLTAEQREDEDFLTSGENTVADLETGVTNEP